MFILEIVIVDYQELIDYLRCRINPQYVDCIGTESYDCKQYLEAIESLLVENERLNAELAKYRDAPCVAYATTNEEDDLTMLFFDAVEARKYSGDDEPIKLIVKPGE